jgi:hypothetical protein
VSFASLAYGAMAEQLLKKVMIQSYFETQLTNKSGKPGATKIFSELAVFTDDFPVKRLLLPVHCCFPKGRCSWTSCIETLDVSSKTPGKINPK